MVYILYNPHANNGCGAENAEKIKAQLAARAPELLDLTRLDAKDFLNGLPHRRSYLHFLVGFLRAKRD